jgi:hypothetical protein
MSAPTQLTTEQQAAMRLMLTDAVTGPPRHRARLAIAGSGVLTAGLVAAAAVVVSGSPASRAPAMSAPAVLELAAATVRSEPVVKPGQFLVFRTRANYLAITSPAQGPEYAYLSPEIDETFLPYDHDPRTEVRRTTHLPATVFFGAGAREQAAEDGAAQKKVEVTTGPPARIPELGGGFTPPPTDPDTLALDAHELLAFLRADQLSPGASADENAFENAAEIFRTGPVKPPTRAALYRALALIPSVTVITRTAVLDGSSGTALALSTASGASRQEIIIDPGSGQYIGERQVTVDGFGEIPAGTEMESTSVTLSVADQAP